MRLSCSKHFYTTNFTNVFFILTYLPVTVECSNKNFARDVIKLSKQTTVY